MSFAADHYFWQQRVEKEIVARNKFVEDSFIKGPAKSKLLDGKVSESFNLYEPGTSDPNLINPKEFKSALGTGVSLDPNTSAYEKLQMLTSQSNQEKYNDLLDAGLDFVKRNNTKQDYIPYKVIKKSSNNAVSEAKRSQSHFDQKRSLATIAEQNLKGGANVQNLGSVSTTGGKKKRKRFNEQLDDTLSRKSGASYNQTSSSLAAVKPKPITNLTGAGLTLSSIQKLPQLNKINDEDLASQISKNQQKIKSTASVKQVQQTPGVQKPLDTQSSNQKSYKDKIIELINELDDNQLEQLGEELNMKEDQKETESKGLNADDLAKLDKESKEVEVGHGEEQQTISEMKSVVTEQKSGVSKRTSSTMVSKLQKQLDEEKRQREKLRDEIEELKKMNHELCNVILSTNSQAGDSKLKK